jgi:hypothetical protein
MRLDIWLPVMRDPNRGKWSNYAAGTAEDQFIAQKQVQWVLSNSPKNWT